MDDHAAIERCRAGDNEAFRHIVEHYQAAAIGHATAILGNHEDALDAVQEAFIDAFQALDQIDLSRRFYPWFYVILRNRCYKLAHGRKKSEMSSSDEMEILAPAANIRPEESMLGSRPRGRRLGFSSPNNLRLSTLAVVFSVAYTIY